MQLDVLAMVTSEILSLEGPARAFASRRANASKIGSWPDCSARWPVVATVLTASLGVRGGAQPAAGAAAASRRNRPAAGRSAPQPPVFRAGINFVRVDVIVSDKTGNPVADLQAERLRGHRRRQAAEDRHLQADQARRRHAPTPIKEPPQEIRTDYDEEAEAARDDVRLFAIFLDDYHVRRGASMAVREPARRSSSRRSSGRPTWSA